MCLCFWTVTTTHIGTTNAEGQFKGGISQPGYLEIRKTGYYDADKLNNSIYEETNNKRIFRLFKKATIQITKNPSANYNNPVLELRAILKDGTTKKFAVDNYPLYYLIPSPVYIIGIGDMKNRIIVRDGTNVLLQTDFYVPANSTTEITLNY